MALSGRWYMQLDNEVELNIALLSCTILHIFFFCWVIYHTNHLKSKLCGTFFDLNEAASIIQFEDKWSDHLFLSDCTSLCVTYFFV